jgi:hypothetical protein
MMSVITVTRASMLTLSSYSVSAFLTQIITCVSWQMYWVL